MANQSANGSNAYYPFVRQMGPYFGPYYSQPVQGYVPSYPQIPSGSTIQAPGAGMSAPQIPGMLPIEQSYIENIFRLNKGKRTTVYMSFEGSKEWNSKIFQGIVEAAGRDHLILSDPKTGHRYLLPLVYFNYAVFEEELDYEYPFASAQRARYAPR
ncbi:spore coat protein GerQ [Fervidibacillus albus]|uniref:Spore coat protein GerQ n=1 Tax=Fervidibacillus albus TaxID=2980026 RepID=A0A9E8LU86_9BACI|nr:spore coat protein GerQ [Fervidibacillus albus]WAA09621.1 spore coat protein GerQ [Fervidibacillus albus]